MPLYPPSPLCWAGTSSATRTASTTDPSWVGRKARPLSTEEILNASRATLRLGSGGVLVGKALQQKAQEATQEVVCPARQAQIPDRHEEAGAERAGARVSAWLAVAEEAGAGGGEAQVPIHRQEEVRRSAEEEAGRRFTSGPLPQDENGPHGDRGGRSCAQRVQIFAISSVEHPTAWASAA